MAFLDHAFLPTRFPGITWICSVSCVKTGQNERFALCLTHEVSKWKIQTLVHSLELLVIGIDHEPIDLQYFI